MLLSAKKANRVATQKQASSHVHCCTNTPLIFTRALRDSLHFAYFAKVEGEVNNKP